MSQITSPNQNTLNSFLREIGYASIISNLPPERKIVVNWDEALSKLTDQAGVVWSRYKGDASIGQGGQRFEVCGRYQAVLRSVDKEFIALDVVSLGSGRQALDLMLKKASLVTTMKIRDKLLKHPECFADFCLEGRASADKETRFVYGNIYVEITSASEDGTKSVAPVARYVHEMMRRADEGAERSPGTVPVVRLALSRPSLKVGESLGVAIDTGSYPENDWDAKILVKDKKLEYIDGDYGKEEYEAVAAGVETVKAILMNRNTLQFAEVEKQVTIEP